MAAKSKIIGCAAMPCSAFKPDLRGARGAEFEGISPGLGKLRPRPVVVFTLCTLSLEKVIGRKSLSTTLIWSL